MPSLLDPDNPIHDGGLLKQLRGRRLLQDLRMLAVIGANRCDELSLIDRRTPGSALPRAEPQ